MSFRPPVEIEQSRMSATRFYANRKEMIKALRARLPANPRVVEVGVGLGDFSAFVLQNLAPSKFIGIDYFEMHKIEMLWGRATKEIFGGKTHEQFYRERFAPEGARVDVMTGLSWEQLDLLPRGGFDLIYVDAGHDYESVMRDLEATLGALAPEGIIVANDYTMYDPFLKADYGVVQAVNEFIQTRDFVLDGFALECNMFCDVAFSRRAR